jgi:hypothetical protein
MADAPIFLPDIERGVRYVASIQVLDGATGDPVTPGALAGYHALLQAKATEDATTPHLNLSSLVPTDGLIVNATTARIEITLLGSETILLSPAQGLVFHAHLVSPAGETSHVAHGYVNITRGIDP